MVCGASGCCNRAAGVSCGTDRPGQDGVGHEAVTSNSCNETVSHRYR